MSPRTSGEWLLLFVTALVVLLRIVKFKRTFGHSPLNHGPGFFLGVEVSPGFYEGEGAGWLKRYHTACLAELSIQALALLAVLVSGRWFLLPLWAGGTAILVAATFLGFASYTRCTLGAKPPVRPSFAIPLEPRRLRDYISWPAETLIAATYELCMALASLSASSS